MEASYIGEPALSAYMEVNWTKATWSPISYRDHLLHQQDIDITNMEDVRKSLSKLKKDFKHRIGGKKRAGADVVGERVSSSASLLRSDPHVTVDGHDGEGSGISADVSQANSRDPSPHPEPVPADEGRLDDPRREVDADEKEVTRKNSSLDPGVEDAAGSGPGREVKAAASPLSAAPIPPKQEPESTWTLSPSRCV